MEDFKLYNINGRLYDPVVCRFLSPDPYVQDPGFTQSLNRYSYCLNNPLKFTDPTGEFAWWYYLAQLAGNYVFNMADNTINKKMPMNQAVRQFNFNMNYSPGSNRFFTPGVDAQMAVWNMETGKGLAYSWSTVYAYAGVDEYLVFKGTTRKFEPAPRNSGMLTIEMNRILESPKSTLSEFYAYGPTPLIPISGYILEPGGPSTIESNQDRRIPTGIYHVAPYSSKKFPNSYNIYNDQVSPDRRILIHSGVYHSHTSGCLLPGNSYSMVSGNYAIWGSRTTVDQLRSSLGTNNATLIVRTSIPFYYFYKY